MMFRKLVTGVSAVAVMSSVAAGAAGPASAVNNIKTFGTQMTLEDPATEIGYTVAGLGPSSDVIPYPVAGRLFESVVTVDAIRGTVAPAVPFFNARGEDGVNYRVLSTVSTPQGLSGAAVPQGASSSGKIYFDVVGPDPNSVVFSDAAQDYMAWINP